MPVAVIIGAVIAAGVSVGVGVSSAKRTREANEEGLALANIARSDKLKIDDANEKMNKWQMRFSEKQFGNQKSEARKDRAERSEQKGYDRSQEWQKDSLNLVNGNPAMRESFIGSMRKAA